MALSPEEKARRNRDRMLEKAAEFQTSTYARKFVAPLFQKMIRAEFATDKRRYVTAIVEGELQQVERAIGQCVCVTCGRVARWNARDMQTGHFLAGRSNSILFEEENVAPQCSHCNGHLSGAVLEYNQWMEYVRGREAILRLRQLKTQERRFGREELVDMRIHYAARLKAAEERMKCGSDV